MLPPNPEDAPACNQQVQELVRALLLPLSLYVVADAVQYCCGGVLQGCGAARKTKPRHALARPLG